MDMTLLPPGRQYHPTIVDGIDATMSRGYFTFHLLFSCENSAFMTIGYTGLLRLSERKTLNERMLIYRFTFGKP
jgi:hypothetical protein